jgi:serine/threonine-protein kinase RsbT
VRAASEVIDEDDPGPDASQDLAELTGLIRRVVAGRVSSREAVDDIVQETVMRLLATSHRLDGRAIGPYAIVTARNLVASQWRRADTGRRHEHRLFDPRGAAAPDDALLEREEAEAIRAALERLSPREREVLVAHEVEGRDTRSLAEELRSTPGAVAAQLGRSRAKLRVEYLIELDREPPTGQCRPVLLALSAGDRRRQAELDAGYHLLDCDYCASLSEPLFDRRAAAAPDQVRVAVMVDADIVVVRQRARDLALQAGFSAAEATMIATAVSEIARNIVRFARRGEVTVTLLSEGDATGVTVVARDAGPGIRDVDRALEAGFTTYGGRGLGLPGSRRLMDEFAIASEVGRGTTVTMTKWRR